jgi:hypothetical protein
MEDEHLVAAVPKEAQREARRLRIDEQVREQHDEPAAAQPAGHVAQRAARVGPAARLQPSSVTHQLVPVPPAAARREMRPQRVVEADQPRRVALPDQEQRQTRRELRAYQNFDGSAGSDDQAIDALPSSSTYARRFVSSSNCLM